MYYLKRDIQENYKHRIRRSVLTAQLNKGLEMKFVPKITSKFQKSAIKRDGHFGLSTALKSSMISQRGPPKKISL